jgi:hypothetical protein
MDICENAECWEEGYMWIAERVGGGIYVNVGRVGRGIYVEC